MCKKTVGLSCMFNHPPQGPVLQSKSVVTSKKKKHPVGCFFFLEVTPGFEPGNQGFADPCLTTWLCHRLFIIICRVSQKAQRTSYFFFHLKKPHVRVTFSNGAGDETRTRYLHHGKVALYQMSYARKWCPEPESNQRHGDFQSPALPTELSGQNGDPERARTVDL